MKFQHVFLLGFIAILNLTEPAHAEELDSPSCPPSSALSKKSRPLILNPYCRIFKGCRNGAVYMTIHLPSPDVLKKASVDPEIADHVELHTHQEKNGVMQMTPLPEIALSTGILELKPGGDHIMLIGLLKELEPGKKLRLSLEFENAGSLEVEALVEGPQWKKEASKRKICHCEEE